MDYDDKSLKAAYVDTKDYQHKMGVLVSRAWTDDNFAAKVKSDPRGALADVGITVPPSVPVDHIPLPPRPEGLSDEVLTKGVANDGSCAACAGSASCPTCSAGTAGCAC